MDSYNAHPWHLYIYSVPLLLAGSCTFAYGYEMLGGILFLLGVGVGVWIVYQGISRDNADYWVRVSEAARKLDSTRNPEVWTALGFKVPQRAPPKFVPQEQLPTSTQLFVPPVSDAKLQVFVDGVLMGQSLAESRWGGKGKPMSPNEIRDLKKELRRLKMVRWVNEQNPKLGEELTAKGRRELFPYASPGIQALVAPNYVAPAPSKPLLNGGAPTLPNM